MTAHNQMALKFVSLEHVGMRYGTGPEILSDITLELEQGSFHFLTGRSGAGKSSLLKLLYLANRPSRGIISMFGRDLSAVTRQQLPMIRRRIGVVFQDFRLLDHLTTLENVALPVRVAEGNEDEVRAHAKELLEWVGLGDRLGARPSTLSGGEKQCVAIARAVIARPSLLLADEPTGNVDPEMGRRLLGLFVELNRIGTTVVIATHDQQMIDQIPAKLLRLDDGRLETSGTLRADQVPVV